MSSKGLAIDNTPRNPDSRRALRQLCLKVLDPLVDTFGPIELTYGFSSVGLASRIKSRIAPSLDQHVAHETRRTGTSICARLGAAVDFKVPSRSSAEVAKWIVEQTPFDRLYYYGSRRPLHVSVGPEESRAIVVMEERRGGGRIPRVVTRDTFLRRMADR
jgi:hypothetical protein